MLSDPDPIVLTLTPDPSDSLIVILTIPVVQPRSKRPCDYALSLLGGIIYGHMYIDVGSSEIPRKQ